MINIISEILATIAFILFLNSYKKISNKESAFLLIFLNIFSIILKIYLSKFGIWYIILKLIMYYSISRLTLKKKINLLDIFYIQFQILNYCLLKKFISLNYIPELILIVITLMFNSNKIKKINNKMLIAWNEGEKCLTLRCICLILFNMSFYIIFKFLL